MSKSRAPLSDPAKERLQAKKLRYEERLKRQEECLVRRQHRREEIIANKEARRLRKEAREREREEKRALRQQFLEERERLAAADRLNKRDFLERRNQYSKYWRLSEQLDSFGNYLPDYIPSPTPSSPETAPLPRPPALNTENPSLSSPSTEPSGLSENAETSSYPSSETLDYEFLPSHVPTDPALERYFRNLEENFKTYGSKKRLEKKTTHDE